PGTGAPRPLGALGLGEELDDRRLPAAVGRHADPGQAARAELLLDEALEAVDLAPREGVRGVDRQALDQAAALHGLAEGPEAAAPEALGQVGELELDARVRLVAAVARPAVGVREAGGRPRQV